jgi:hypothetical protein
VVTNQATQRGDVLRARPAARAPEHEQHDVALVLVELDPAVATDPPGGTDRRRRATEERRGAVAELGPDHARHRGGDDGGEGDGQLQ